MAFEAIDVANYLVNRSLETGKPTTNLHLQKSLYFLQAYFIAEGNELLFEDDIEMWRLGPVVPVVYDEYKLFGSSKISMIPTTPVFNYETLLIDYKNVDNIALDEETKAVLNPLIDSLLEKDKFYLMDKSLSHDIYLKHKEDILNSDTVRGKYIYNTEEMVQFFSKKENHLELIQTIF